MWSEGAHAQDATLNGTVRDNTGAVLPGVTVTATHEAAGTTFVSVTDERGLYRVPVRAGLRWARMPSPPAPRDPAPVHGGTLLEPAAPAAKLTDPREVLESVFGYREFRPGQRHIIDAVLAGRDCIGVMPTGAG